MDLNAQLKRHFASQKFWDEVRAWAKDDYSELDSSGQRIVKEVRTAPRVRGRDLGVVVPAGLGPN